MSPFHTPVLCNEILSYLSDQRVEQVLDGTCGAGGHAKAILAAHPEIICYTALDQDLHALDLAKRQLEAYQTKVCFCHTNFSQYELIPDTFDCILLDLGVSSMQLDQAERGFSFMREGPLDMRMNQEEQEGAEEIVNYATREELIQILSFGGEERGAKKIAQAIVEARKKVRIETTTQLAKIIERVAPRRGRLHGATLTFQSLRMAVNREIDHLKKALPLMAQALKNHGRLFVISFHSIEDRAVKEFCKQAVMTKEFSLVVRKPLVATRQECRVNPRSRSAKLRIIQKEKLI
jgi:16S rRNA (cytosine1402-N4)-methyltransferase